MKKGKDNNVCSIPSIQSRIMPQTSQGERKGKKRKKERNLFLGYY